MQLNTKTLFGFKKRLFSCRQIETLGLSRLIFRGASCFFGYVILVLSADLFLKVFLYLVCIFILVSRKRLISSNELA